MHAVFLCADVFTYLQSVEWSGVCACVQVSVGGVCAFMYRRVCECVCVCVCVSSDFAKSLFHYYPSCQLAYRAAGKLLHPCLSLASLWMVPQLRFMSFISTPTVLQELVFSGPFSKVHVVCYRSYLGGMVA